MALALFLMTPHQVAVNRANVLLRPMLQTIPGSPFQGGSGGGSSFPISSVATFGTADGAAGSIGFNISSGCEVYEGTVADANEFSNCVTSLDQDSGLTFSVASGIMTVVATPPDTFWQGIFSVQQDVHVYRHLSMVNTNGAGGSSPGNIFLGGIDTVPAIRFSKGTNTPELPLLLTRSDTGNAWDLRRHDERDNDLGAGPCTAPCTDPLLIVRDNSTSTTDYQALGVSGLSGSFRKTLTESSATSVIRIPVAASAGTGGTFHYCVFAADATDQQERCSYIRIAVTNKAATETCGMSNNAGTADASITETEDGNASSISTGTLTYAITCDTTPTNAVDIQINAVSSLTQTTLQARGTMILVGPGEPLPQ